jgi:multidrug efflux pump subunit AcrB
LKTGIAGRIAAAFIDSKLTPLLLIAALLVGAFGTLNTPREEEPQIVVPLVDVFVPYPGATAREVEERITKPLEKIISQIPGVEYIYSMSGQGFAVVSVRYLVGEDMEDSLVKLWATILKHMDRKPPGVEFPLLKTTSIDDVPVLTLTLWSDRYDAYGLRRVAAEVADEIKNIDNVSEVDIRGGLRREVRVILDPAKLEAHRVTPLQIAQQIKSANQQLTAGSFQRLNEEYIVRTGEFLRNAEDVAGLVVGVSGNHPVYMRDVARIEDGPEEVDNYVFYGVGSAVKEAGADHGEYYSADRGEEYPAVTLAVSKRKGSDAMRVSNEVMRKISALEGWLLPSDIHVTETRNYGETASEKVITLLEHLLGAIVAVTIVVGLFLGWRGGLVVFASVPITFALTLFVYYLFGYTLNRVTLFALIFVTGIVVDDSIIVAENVHRHLSMRRLPKLQAAIAAISEVGNPTILATFTVIASVLPMAFVSGLMGPYMSPMPIGASLAMLFSLLVALVGTPWLAYRLLKHHGEEKEYRIEDTRTYRFYDKTLGPLLDNRKRAWTMIWIVTGLLLASVSLFFFRAVEVKILPYDNKSEMQVIIDMPEGTTLEQTARVAKDIAGYLRTVPEVTDYQYYVGTNAPINFNGLVRHYYLRSGPTVADIQVNLVHKSERGDQSHAIAKRLRPRIQEIGQAYRARVKVAEVPPGPPVLSTLVAEIYGPDYDEQIALARRVRDIFERTDGVVDVDWLVEDDQRVYQFTVDKEKAALRGVSTDQIAMSLRMALAGAQADLLHDPAEIEPVGIDLRLARANRASVQDLANVHVRSVTNELIPIADVVDVRETTEEKAIYRKNLQRVVYVTGDVAGAAESPIYAMLDMNEDIGDIELPGGGRIKPLYTRQPFLEEELAMKWDGEWQITYEVFRDLGGAFAVVIVIIYLLTIGWFQSFKTPLVMMIAIPLSLVGIIPGHLIHGAFFTATSMIGMIALAGIMVRNSVLIIDFIELRRRDGGDLKTAVIEAGAVRTRPILLTAGTVVIGAIVILFDPIFQGLAISLMWGAFASTALTLGMVPLVYYMVERRGVARDGS